MDSLFTQNVSDDLEDIPQTQEPVWILGKKYNAIKGFVLYYLFTYICKKKFFFSVILYYLLL